MKGILFLALLLAACGVNNEKKDFAEEAQSIFTSATWCAEGSSNNGAVDTYKFYPDGRVILGKWNPQKLAFDSFNPMKWTVSGDKLTLSADSQKPRDKIYSYKMATLRGINSIQLTELLSPHPVVYQPCILPGDPR